MFLNTTCPGAGTIQVFHGKANDPDIASILVHGVSSQASISGGLVINPPPKTIYQQRLHQLREAGYSTNQKAPLGRSHDQSPGLPNWFDTDTGKATFAVKSPQTAGAIINPPKSVEQVETEAQEGHQSYICSHNAYFLGEQVDRKYKWSRYGKDGRFGVPTPHHNDGRSVSKCAGDLLHSTPPAEYQKGTDRQRTLVSAVHQHLKKVNFHNFNSLLQAFRHYDNCKTSTVPDNMQREALPERPPASEALARPEDLEPAEVGSMLKNRYLDYHMYGTPTVRTDLVAPRIKRVSDSTNYSDQTTAFDLLYPTLYSLRGVHKEHFFCPRTKDEITDIFRNVGVSISEETFAEAWKLASMRHPTGDMCVEIFRDVLKEIQAN
ncbi:EF-hand domain-containing family member B-like [Salmo trutta]|uniref:EF-hand domain-containing family member B-like n=1 Tax=Salmo trutta TaxID=8032 RepID=UPI0011324246|nr:EF-hand domain-containing family member B-like [Salmo trutta]